jgi:predicted peptidase
MADSHGFLPRRHDRSRYMLFVPKHYDGQAAFPLVLFLHGAGETGWDGQRPAAVGLGRAIRRCQDTFGYLALFPQSHQGTWRASSEDGLRALAILDEVCAEFRVDRRRIHLTGISMGGFGTWSLALENPARWASITPVCGGGDPTRAARIKDLPCWAFHGEQDDIVPVAHSRSMVEALRTAGGQPRYTEFPGVAHNCWDLAYSTPELFDWMAAQSR